MAKTKKIKKEELEELKTLINNFNKLQLELGRLDIEKHQILHRVSESQSYRFFFVKKRKVRTP